VQPQDHTPKGVHGAMTQASTTAIKGFWTEFESTLPLQIQKMALDF
jgi:hypothetical protein